MPVACSAPAASVASRAAPRTYSDDGVDDGDRVARPRPRSATTESAASYPAVSFGPSTERPDAMYSVQGWRRWNAHWPRASVSSRSRQRARREILAADAFAVDGVEHEVEQLSLARHVGVQRHRPDAEALGDSSHRDRVEALGVGQVDRGRTIASRSVPCFGPRVPRGVRPHSSSMLRAASPRPLYSGAIAATSRPLDKLRRAYGIMPSNFVQRIEFPVRRGNWRMQ